MIRTTTDGSTTTPPYRFTPGEPDSVYTPDDGIHPDMPGFLFITGGGTAANVDPAGAGADALLEGITSLGITVGQLNAPWYLGGTGVGDTNQAIADCIAYGRAHLGWNSDLPGALGISNGWVCLIDYLRTHDLGCLIGCLTVTAASIGYIDNPLGLRARMQSAYSITYPTPIPDGFDPYRDFAEWSRPGTGSKIQGWYSAGDLLYPGPQMSFLARLPGRAEMHNVGAYGHLGTLEDTAAPVEHVDVPTMTAFVERLLLAA